VDPTPGQAEASGAVIQPKDKKELASDRVQNPHDPEATYAVKGQGEKKKEHVGYKVQVAETVCEAILAPGEPTRNFIMGIVTHPAYQSDEAGALKMEQEQARMGLEKPPVQYVDAAYISTQQLVQAQAEGRELIGPAPAAPHKAGRFAMEDFQISVEEHQALCPAGNENTQCSRLEEAATGKVSYRFEFSTHCHDCPLRDQCLGKDQRHRTLVVGEHHTVLQARRQEQQTLAFKQRMKHRNGIEGTQSELVRGHGRRRARYRGLAKVKLQNYFMGAAGNVKRWIRRAAWNVQQALLPVAAEATVPTAN
jgi:transposase